MQQDHLSPSMLPRFVVVGSDIIQAELSVSVGVKENPNGRLKYKHLEKGFIWGISQK